MTTGDTSTLLEPAPPGREGGHYDDWRSWHSEQVWRGPRPEVVLRFAAAALVAVYYLLSLWTYLNHPRYVTDYRALLRDANAGRVVAVEPYGVSAAADLSRSEWFSRSLDGRVRWQTHDGRYEAQLPEKVDIEAAVRAQPYVTAHPESVTFGLLPETPRLPEELIWLLAFAVLVNLVGAPQPRLLTKWGWFWVVALGVGLIPYLVFGGSTRRATPAPPGPRLNGWMAWLAPTVITVAVILVAGVLTSVGLRAADAGSLRGVLNPAPVTTGDFREPPRER